MLFVPLNKLKKSPRNARKTPHSEAHIEALSASIAAKGMLQNLVAILRARGRLAGSINYAATNDEARIGSAVEYAAIHQLGGAIKQPDRLAKIYRKREADGKIGRRFVRKSEADVVTDVTIPGRVITIPARPYLGLSAADETAILEDAVDWLSP
ncbi:phage virion morphogenesis protein [Paracoccus sp. 22332]|uniref:phage virion morphogenesis protein n=1 Tax=Paracoccus sp. 22332 TaxID=3453913 RepID=UPI003F84B154